VAEATNASEIWLGSLVVASATVRALSGRSEVTFVVSGAPNEGEEDLACAEFIAAQLQGRPYSCESAIAAVRSSRAAARHRSGDFDFPIEDVDCATSIDAFDFAMRAERGHSGWIAKRHFARG
jgi:2-phosphosulfolactate phosphatase